MRYGGEVACMRDLLFIHATSLPWAFLWGWKRRWRLWNKTAQLVVPFHRVSQSATEVTDDGIDKSEAALPYRLE
jgi:hypothetical protein